jgi:hypothetical protein
MALDSTATGAATSNARTVPLFERDGIRYDRLGPRDVAGSSYDYVAQSWRDGHDHSHTASQAPDAAPLYCGGDLATCAPLVERGR